MALGEKRDQSAGPSEDKEGYKKRWADSTEARRKLKKKKGRSEARMKEGSGHAALDHM